MFRSTLTERQKFWIFLAICLYVPTIFRASFILDSENLAWTWLFLYPLLACSLLQPASLLLGFYAWIFL